MNLQSLNNITPGAQSQAFRANLAKLVSPLRRVRPRVPFFQLAAHRVPTLWGLYRGLLRDAGSDNIRFRVRMLFRKNQHLTGTDRTREQLLKGYKWLHTFQSASAGDPACQAILERYDKFIDMKCKKAEWAQRIDREIAWKQRLRSRPILTGGFIRPTLFNPPLPRMKPQPYAISRMIDSRMRARDRLIESAALAKEMRAMARHEALFEEGLMSDSQSETANPVFSGPEAPQEWERPIQTQLADIRTKYERYKEREATPFPPALVEQIREARRNKVINKTREHMRERRGEVLHATILRRRRGPPAHVLATMTAEQRRVDKVLRGSVSEVGYVGALKAKKGWKVHQGRKRGLEGVKEREENERAGRRWSVEDAEWVDEKERSRLDKAAEEVRLENERRRKAFEESDPV